MLESELESVSRLPPAERGRRFEKWLARLFGEAGLDPRTSYRPRGEEIDGSFVWHGRIMLLEAKWTSHPLPASEVYRFKGKVDGKLVGTVGVCVSMSGFSEDAVDALVAGKSVNVILFGSSDVWGAATHGVAPVLTAKLRAAAEEGVVLLPYSPSARESASEEVMFVVEGVLDVQVVEGFAARLNAIAPRPIGYRVVPANGAAALAGVARALRSAIRTTRVVVLADSEVETRVPRGELRELFSEGDIDVIFAEPGVDGWIPWPPTERGVPRTRTIGARPALIASADLERLVESDAGFRRFAALFGVRPEAPGFSGPARRREL